MSWGIWVRCKYWRGRPSGLVAGRSLWGTWGKACLQVWNSWIYEAGMSESAKFEASKVWDVGRPSWVLSISWTKNLYHNRGAKSSYLTTVAGVINWERFGGGWIIGAEAGLVRSGTDGPDHSTKPLIITMFVNIQSAHLPIDPSRPPRPSSHSKS